MPVHADKYGTVLPCIAAAEYGTVSIAVSYTHLVRAGKGQKLARIRSRDGIDEIHAENRLKSQAGEEELLARADVVLTNDGTLEQLRKQIGEYFYGKSGN